MDIIHSADGPTVELLVCDKLTNDINATDVEGRARLKVPADVFADMWSSEYKSSENTPDLYRAVWNKIMGYFRFSKERAPYPGFEHQDAWEKHVKGLRAEPPEVDGKVLNGKRYCQLISSRFALVMLAAQLTKRTKLTETEARLKLRTLGTSLFPNFRLVE